MRKNIFGVVVSVLLVSLGLNVKAAEEKTEAFVWKEEDGQICVKVTEIPTYNYTIVIQTITPTSEENTYFESEETEEYELIYEDIPEGTEDCYIETEYIGLEKPDDFWYAYYPKSAGKVTVIVTIDYKDEAGMPQNICVRYEDENEAEANAKEKPEMPNNVTVTDIRKDSMKLNAKPGNNGMIVNEIDKEKAIPETVLLVTEEEYSFNRLIIGTIIASILVASVCVLGKRMQRSGEKGLFK